MPGNKKIALIALVVVGLATGASFFMRQQAPVGHDASVSDSGSEIFLLSLEDYEGKTVSLANFRGQPLVINSWAAWCPFCRKELADLALLQKEFGDSINVIAVDRAESKDTAQKYTDELGVTGGMVFLLDPSDSLYRSIGGFSMPETIFMDKDGRIVIHKRGPMDINEMREKIQQLILN